jgi:hypothetical protein
MPKNKKIIQTQVAKLYDYFGHEFISPYDKRHLWWHDSELEKRLRAIAPDSKNRNRRWAGSTKSRLTQRRWNLYQLASTTLSLRGDTAEFGVASGISSRLIAAATQNPKNSSKKHWMFDSFEGLPAPG